MCMYILLHKFKTTFQKTRSIWHTLPGDYGREI
jgi:hypothetical protein